MLTERLRCCTLWMSLRSLELRRNVGETQGKVDWSQPLQLRRGEKERAGAIDAAILLAIAENTKMGPSSNYREYCIREQLGKCTIALTTPSAYTCAQRKVHIRQQCPTLVYNDTGQNEALYK